MTEPMSPLQRGQEKLRIEAAKARGQVLSTEEAEFLGTGLTTHEKQVVKMERQRQHVERLKRKVAAGGPKADTYRQRLAEVEGVQEEIGHAEEIERLRARRRARRGSVTVEPPAGTAGVEGR